MDIDAEFVAACARLNSHFLKPEVQGQLSIRKQAGEKIDSETAVLASWPARIVDPYGFYPNFPEVLDRVGRVIFARSPESYIWVQFSDLPEATEERLRERIKAGDFNKSNAEQNSSRQSPITFDQARKEVQFALSLHRDTSGMVIEEFSQLPDGRLQFIICEHPPEAD